MKHVKVLLVDDSVLMRKLFSVTVEAEGHSVTEAMHGAEALEILRQRSDFDLIVTDVHMPVLDGLSLIKQIRNLPAYKRTPVLVLSTEINADKKRSAREAGASGWIVKPFDPAQLLAAIGKVIG